jgi:ribosomal protein L29
MNKTKSKKPVEITLLTNQKLTEDISLKKKELMSLRFRSKLGELKDTSLFKKARKNIAKSYTELRNRREDK